MRRARYLIFVPAVELAESDCNTVDRCTQLDCQSRDHTGVNATGQEKTYGHIRHQMTATESTTNRRTNAPSSSVDFSPAVPRQ